MKKNIRRILSFLIILTFLFTNIPLDAVADENNMTYSDNTDITVSIIYNNVTIDRNKAVALKAPNGRLKINSSLTVSEGASLTADEGQILELQHEATTSGIIFYKNTEIPGEYDSYNEINADVWTAFGEGNMEFKYNAGKWILFEQVNPQNPPEPQPVNYSVRFDQNTLYVSINGQSLGSEVSNQAYPTLTDNTDDLVFTFQAKPRENDNEPVNKFYGIRVIVDGDPRIVTEIKAGTANLPETVNESGIYQYTIGEADFDKNIEIEAISNPYTFNNEFFCSFNDQNDVNVKYSIAGGEQNNLANEDIKSFVSGTEYTFTLTPPTGETTVYKVAKQLNDGSTSDMVVSASNTFTWTPSDDNGCSFRIYWTEAQYNYENLHASDGQFEVEYSWNGNGTVTHTGGVSAATYNNQTRVVVTNNTASLSITMTPTPGGAPANTIEEVRLEGNTVSTDSYPGGIYSMPLNNNYKRLEVRFTEDDNPGGGGQGGNNPPSASGYRVQYQSDAVEVRLGGSLFTHEGQNQDYPTLTAGVDDLIFTFKAKPSVPNNQPYNFYGLKVTINSNPQVVNYIKAGAIGLSKTVSEAGNYYTYTIPEANFNSSIEIEAITDPVAFDNEFIIFYDNDNNANVSCNIPLVGVTNLQNGDIKTFNTASNYVFTLTPPTGVSSPYKVEIETNDGTLNDATVNNNTFTFNPGNGSGCTIHVYWTEAQYNFEHLHAGEGQFEVEYAWEGNGTVTHTGGVNDATYKDTTKVILNNGSGGNFSLTLTPDTNRSVREVRRDGQEVYANEYAGGTYGLHLVNDESVRVEIRFTDSQNPGGNDPSARDFDLYQHINNRSFAYAGADSSEIRLKFIDEIWATAFQNNNQSPFDRKEKLTAEVTVGAFLISMGSEIEGKSYYTFIIDMDHDDAASDTDDITGKIYVLTSEKDFVVRGTKSGIRQFIIIEDPGVDEPPSAQVVIDYDTNGLLVFGNGAEMHSLGSSGYFNGAHITNESVSTLTQFGRQLAIYKPTFVGTSVQTHGESGYAAAWGFAQYPVATTNDSTPTNPSEYEVYFGNTDVTLGRPNVPGATVQSVESVSTSLPDTAVNITSSGSGVNKTFNVEFLSNFYDEVPITITYDTTSGLVTQYLLIRRVGIDIQGYRQSGAHESDLQLNHGTDIGPTLTNFWDSENKCGIFATYYYPTGTSTPGTNTVELYVTKTWYAENGSVARVERETVTNSIQHSNVGLVGSSVAMDDFQVFTGPIANCPDKIEIISLKTGSNDSNFGGANLGGGAGVVWEKAVSLR